MKKPGLHSCNVLEAGAAVRELWQFRTLDGQVSLANHLKIPEGERLPAPLVAKDWRNLWQKRLNIAWLPAEQVFLQVIYLPPAEYTELVSMAELQLEKISPLPANQVVWTIELLPRTEQELQAVIVVIVPRETVEEFLGKLEGDGFVADRLELPQLRQLEACRPEPDDLWIFSGLDRGHHLCLIAWWSGGVFRQIQLLHLPLDAAAGPLLTEQLTKAAWAGEMQGWFGGSPRVTLVSEPEQAAILEPALSGWLGMPIATSTPLNRETLAQRSGQGAAAGRHGANLLPVEFAARYHQRFVDRLWMNGLGAVVAVYMACVLIYFGFLQVFRFQQYRAQKEVAQLSASYTNTVKLKEQIDVLQNQLNLKYAALDSLRAASELLPTDLVLSHFNFQRGQKLALQGVAPQDQVEQLTRYNDDLRKASSNGRPLFSKVDRPTYDTRGQTIAWQFTCELNRVGLE